MALTTLHAFERFRNADITLSRTFFDIHSRRLAGFSW